MSKAPTIKPLSKADETAATEAAQKVVETHRRLSRFIRPGMSLGVIDAEVGRVLDELGCRSCFIGYKAGGSSPFPSHACVSVNECVVHGYAGYRAEPLKVGDLFKLDIGVWHKGFIGDAAWTYSIGEPSAENRKLMECGKESLRLGVAAIRPENTWLDWARAVQNHVESVCGFHCVRGLGGHGIGRKLHGYPYVSNVVPSDLSEWAEATHRCEPGVIVAVEPMISVGTSEIITMADRKRAEAKKAGKGILSRSAQVIAPDVWPLLSADASMSVHYEHDVLVTENGPRVLTAELTTLNDVIPA